VFTKCWFYPLWPHSRKFIILLVDVGDGEHMERSVSQEYVSHEVERFGEYLRGERRTTATVRSYNRNLGVFLTFVGKTVGELTKADMQAWKTHIAGLYCENSMVPMVCAVNCYMVRIANRPELKMQPPRWVEKDVIPMAETEVNAFIRESKRPMLGCKGHKTFEVCHRDYMMTCLLYYGGLRASEVVTLRLSGLDLDRRMLRVHEGKEKNYSMVLLNDTTVTAIREYLAFTRALLKPQAGYEDHLVLTEGGTPMSRTNLWVTVKRIGIRAGIKKNIYPHLFRHTMATKMAEKGLNAFEIQAQTRHKHIETVQKYVHISEGARRAAYERAFEPDERINEPSTKPTPVLGPSLYAQGNPQVVMMTPQQLEQVLQAAIGASTKPLPGYQ